MTSERGFSLIELVVMLVMAGILAAVVIPRFNQPEIEASWMEGQYISALPESQRQAVAQRRTVYVLVTPSTLELCYSAASPCPLADEVGDFATSNQYKITAPSGVALSALTFSFNALGQPSAGAPFVVGTATVERETGYVH